MVEMVKIAVCGSAFGTDEDILNKAEAIGREIAKNKDILLTGGCKGYPYASLKGALLEGCRVIVYSPAKDESEHREKYDFPIEQGVEYRFTGLGIPGRNIPLVESADSVIIIGGKIGTLNEFTLAFHQKKRIGVLEGSGGVTKLIREIADICDKEGEKDNIIYEQEPRILIHKLVNQ